MIEFRFILIILLVAFQVSSKRYQGERCFDISVTPASGSTLNRISQGITLYFSEDVKITQHSRSSTTTKDILDDFATETELLNFCNYPDLNFMPSSGCFVIFFLILIL